VNFKEVLNNNPLFALVASAANELNVPTYVVGGFVRDLILKRPCKDLDFVCIGSGEALAMKVAELHPSKPQVTVFKNFGTAMLKVDDWELEFVGARKESYNRDSRKPVVENGTLEDDQNRRDFTINALAIGLNANNYGEVLDSFGGVEDIARKIIKTPLDSDITFSDDPLRMMRAIRFATQLNFDIEPLTFDAIIRNKERIEIVSKERIADELNKIILAKMPSYGFKLLLAAGLLQMIFPELVALMGTETIDGKSHKDNFYHTLQVLDNVAEMSDDLWLRWAAILHDIAKPATKRFNKKVGFTFHGHEELGARMVSGIFRRMKLPMNEKMKSVEKLVRIHLRPIALVKDEVTDSAVRRLLYEAGDDVDNLMKLCRADVTSKNDNKVKRYLQNFDKVEQKLIDIEAKDKIRNFQPVVTGEDIMAAFGLKPNAQVGEIKIRLREAVLDGLVPNTFDENYAFMIKIGEEMGLKRVE
jgi:putative nucleotidyltransferase with HDIG domain